MQRLLFRSYSRNDRDPSGYGVKKSFINKFPEKQLPGLVSSNYSEEYYFKIPHTVCIEPEA